ncbi:MAG TPA: GNAT family N-acetyltransferase [Caulobacteraceae bacterium]|nr:GNAT family N-acetyltransferase [Caulobacteraceae bacterium]
MPVLDPDIDIRPLIRAEAEKWRTLRLKMLQEHPTAFLSSYEDWLDRDLDAFAAQIPEDGVDALFGAFLGGELCGSARFNRETRRKVAHRGDMTAVYVDPSLRGRGVGEALVQAVIDRARQHVVVLLCGVGAGNTRAGDLYRRLGFVDYGVLSRAMRVNGEDYDEDLLIMNLDEA